MQGNIDDSMDCVRIYNIQRGEQLTHHSQGNYIVRSQLFLFVISLERFARRQLHLKALQFQNKKKTV